MNVKHAQARIHAQVVQHLEVILICSMDGAIRPVPMAISLIVDSAHSATPTARLALVHQLSAQVAMLVDNTLSCLIVNVLRNAHLVSIATTIIVTDAINLVLLAL